MKIDVLAVEKWSAFFRPLFHSQNVCYERDRQALLASGAPEARYYVFAPALFGPVLIPEIYDPQALEICSRLE